MGANACYQSTYLEHTILTIWFGFGDHSQQAHTILQVLGCEENRTKGSNGSPISKSNVDPKSHHSPSLAAMLMITTHFNLSLVELVSLMMVVSRTPNRAEPIVNLTME